MKVAELGRKHGVSEQTIYRWQSKYGGLEVSEVRRLRLLEEEQPATKADGGGFEPRQTDARRRHQDVKKLVMPAAKCRAAGRLQQTHQVSQRRVCRVLQLHRSVARYDSVCSRDDEALKALAHRYPCYGYLLHRLLRNEGLVVNRKRTYRVYVELRLQVHTQRRKKLRRPQVAMPLPTRVNERCMIGKITHTTCIFCVVPLGKMSLSDQSPLS